MTNKDDLRKTRSYQPNELSEEIKVSLKTRIISAIVALIIVVPLVILGDIFYAVLMAGILFASTFEIVRCAKGNYSFLLYACAFVIVCLIAFWPMIANIEDWSNWRIFSGFSSFKLSVTLLMLSAFALFFMVLIDKSFTVRDACFIFTLGVLISLGIQGMCFLRYFPSYDKHLTETSLPYFNSFDNAESCLLALYVAFGSLFTDVGAYFFGIFFGHKKINERISSKKTWAGFFGGIFTSAVITIALAFILAACGHPIGGVFTFDKWYHIVILSILMPFVATLGDFVFSSVKRYYGIKE